MSEPGISSAFEAISEAIRNVENETDIEEALTAIFKAVEVIAPEITEVAHGLTNAEIEKALLDFHTRATQDKPDGEAGNTSAQTFLTLVIMAEIKRRAALDGLTALEWGGRERIRGFLHD